MKQKVLCVDDEEAVVNFMKLFLSKHYEVHTARSGQEAVEVFEKEGPFSVVLSDVQMPNMSGVELIPKLHDIRSCTVCVLLTGHSDFTLVQELLDSGKVYKYIVKPVLPKTLLEVIDEAIQSAETNPSEPQTTASE